MKKIDEIVDVCEREELGLTVLNMLKVNSEGGVNGLPLYPHTIKAVKAIREISEKVPIIATGGVIVGRQALELIKAGADAVGILTAMIYRGPSAFRKIVEEFIEELKRQGFEDLKQARGYEMRSKGIYELLQEFRYHLVDVIRAEFEEYDRQILFEIKRLDERIDELELRLAELERDRVHRLITMEARRLGMTEEEFLRRVAEFIREGELKRVK